MSISSLSDHALVVFNFLPSMTLHPSRFQDYGATPYTTALAAMPALSGTWHRYWSRQILQQEGLLDAAVTDITAAGLTIAVLQPAALAALARRIGVVLCAPRLRYAISGAAVRALQSALGSDVLRLARDGRALHPGLPGAMFRDADEAARTVDWTGYAALYAAFKSAAPELARRFFLKLPLLLPTVDATATVSATATAQATASTTTTEATSTETPTETSTTNTSAIDSETDTVIDGETAMALTMALAMSSTARGGDGVSN